jgi:outer membrane receptor protein involved in Fe transport/Tfp pilus assembly protein PilF
MKASSGIAVAILCGIVLMTTQDRMDAAQAPAVTPRESASQIKILEIGGKTNVQVMVAGGTQWERAEVGRPLKPGDSIRTREFSTVTIKWSDQSVVRLGELAEVQIQPPPAERQPASFSLVQGLLYFFHRDRLMNARYGTRTASAAIRGTEFVLQAEPNNDRTTLTVLEGEVDLSNEIGAITLKTGDQGIAEPGQQPRKTPAIIVNNVIQWALYYPAIIDLDELNLAVAERDRLRGSLVAYNSGDLLRALDLFPEGEQALSSGEKIYRAGLLLAAGSVDQAEKLLNTVGQTAALAEGQAPSANAASAARPLRLADALRQLIAAVKFQPATLEGQASSNPATAPASLELATEWLAQSYSDQSHANLKHALLAARKSVDVSPNFGFGWARVAELEFSLGHTRQALEALERALQYSPRHAQALTLKGFVLAAQNRISGAISWFNRAIEIDPGLANARLGRGLCLIRQGNGTRGREDLLVAATLEPQRAILRSYLAKAYSDAGDQKRAEHEIQLAKDLDPNDPTSWFYSALMKEQENRVNDAIRDLQKSQEVNNNRGVYRSKFLLDQDRAARSANLARLYADADMSDIAIHEAGRAVTVDYADYSPHVFLANSYEAERRANLSNLRFEAASFNEYLLANLLGPANGRLLAQPVTQLEYSSLFERNRLGLIANTEYFSRGAWHHSSAQYGTYNGSSYSLEAEYRSEPGERFNQDLEIRQLEGKFKHDITPDDSMYFHVIDYRSEGGDILQHFDEREVSSTIRFQEEQTPTVLAGYHHQWSPQNHTLILIGRFDDTLQVSDPVSTVLALDRFFGTITALVPVTVRHSYRSRVEVYAAEAQQIAIAGRHSAIVGVRGQWSKQEVMDRVQDPNGDFLALLGTNNPVSIQNERAWSSTAAIYGYDYLRLSDNLQIMGGLNFTHESVPVNTATAPVSAQRDHQERLTPRAALIWAPWSHSTLRASYAKSLTGSGLGQSVRLEPTQVAGFLQTFRAPAPPSLVGQLDGADLQTADLLWEERLRDTYVSAGAQWLDVKRERRLGLFLSDPLYDPPPTLGLIREQVRFNEYAVNASLHQLVSQEWSFGAQYRLAYARLERSFPEYPGIAYGGLDDNSDWRGWLHTVKLTGLYRHQSGVFARAEGILFAQDRERDRVSFPSDDFWQANFVAGYRFPKQRAEIAVGVLNILDDDYRLDPINQHADLPRSRTFYARLLINF